MKGKKINSISLGLDVFHDSSYKILFSSFFFVWYPYVDVYKLFNVYYVCLCVSFLLLFFCLTIWCTM